MFQFPGFPVPALCVQTGLTGHDPSRVSPFGHSWIDGWLAPPQDLSQLPTSFIGSRCQGIHHVLFITCRKNARARYEILKEHHTHTKTNPHKRKGGISTRDCDRRKHTPSELHKVPTTRTGYNSPVTSLRPTCANTRMCQHTIGDIPAGHANVTLGDARIPWAVSLGLRK
jgi:hypothetical protein